MQPSSDRPSAASSSRPLRRWGPLVALVVVVAIVAVVVVASSGSSKKAVVATGPTTTAGPSGGPGAVSFSEAKAKGLKDTYPTGCDLKTGRVAMPYYLAPECYANVPGGNGGATAQGVTADSVKVVLYEAQPNDPVISFITAAIKDNDTNAQNEATYRGYIKMFESLFQTYGRKVDLQIVQASGVSTDEVAARADAAKVAALKPFAVWGGPVLSTAWADELAADHIICLSCTGGGTPDFYTQRAPYVITVVPSAQQANQIVAEYVGKKLAGHPASHAGDPTLASQIRKFGLLYIDSSADSKSVADSFASQLKTQYGVDLTSVAYTLDPAQLQEEADSAVAKLKAAGVTSVIFSGDPVAPGTFTRQATAQNWFPEWIIGASTLVDTTAFARTFDQRQWAHAFGVSFNAARTTPEVSGAYFLYKWFTGQAPPAANTYGVDFPQPAVFYSALQSAGPDLTADSFRAGLFTIAPRVGAVTNVTFSYGNHGLWPYADYNGIDDATEIWWDPSATGPDEISKQGQGMYRYVDGGRRYVVGQWPSGDTSAFDPANTVTIYDQLPPSDAVPSYPSPAGTSSG
jgi:hypothetical protein